MEAEFSGRFDLDTVKAFVLVRRSCQVTKLGSKPHTAALSPSGTQTHTLCLGVIQLLALSTASQPKNQHLAVSNSRPDNSISGRRVGSGTSVYTNTLQPTQPV